MRKRRILRQKTVARVDGIHFFFCRQRDDAIDIQIRLYGPFALPYQISFIRLKPM